MTYEESSLLMTISLSVAGLGAGLAITAWAIIDHERHRWSLYRDDSTLTYTQDLLQRLGLSRYDDKELTIPATNSVALATYSSSETSSVDDANNQRPESYAYL